MKKAILFSLLLLITACIKAEKTVDPITAWQDMRFGMFIHWGPVSLKGTEIGWSRGREVPTEEYDELYKQFNPIKFNADEWVKIAKKSGMKYIILTTKHHDGFALWDSDATDYDIMNSPFKRDIVKELTEACKENGIKFGTYYSICDWYHPDYPLGSPGGKTKKENPNMEQYVEFLHQQVSELITQYGPLLTMWYDGEWEEPWTHEHGEELYALCKNLQPDILVNNRVDKGREGMHGTTSDRNTFKGDYDTPEQRVGNFQTDWPWESCITICKQWAWKPDDEMKSLKELVHTLVTTAGGDGNLLLNVGPMPDGRIEPRQVERLAELGEWLEQYGDTIYGTRGGPFPPADWGASTHQDQKIYLHVLNRPKDTLQLPAIEENVSSAKLLNGTMIQFQQDENGIEIELPNNSVDILDMVIVLEL